jgi:alpha-amylase
VIQDRTKNLPEGGRPWVAHEVIAQGANEPITTTEYTPLGYVTEFAYCSKITNAIRNFGLLGQTGFNDMTPSDHALVFVDNHDNQRGHGGGGSILTYKSPREYKMGSAFLLANDFGFARVMSSFAFNNHDQGPPHNGDFSTKDVSINGDGTGCGNGWVCEHRWRPIANMVRFRNAVVGTNKQHWVQNDNEISFSRGNKGFFAMSKTGHMNRLLNTGLPAGMYYDLISDCRRQIHVQNNGDARIIIDNNDEPIVAYIVGGKNLIM